MKTRLLLLFCLSIHVLFAQNSDERLHGFAAEIDSLMKEFHTVGMAVAVMEKGEVLFLKGFGYRNNEEKLPVDPNTLFPIASVSKPLTASLIGIYDGRDLLRL